MALTGVAMLLLGAIALVAGSTRHRAFYSMGAERATDAAARVAGRALTPPGIVAPGGGDGATVPEPGTEGFVRIPLADHVPEQLPAPGIPAGWLLKEFAGPSLVELVSDGRLALRLRSERASFALYRDVVVDLRSFPVLSWWWKVVRLPAAGDARQAATDDQGAQVYIVFPRWPSPLTASDVLGYVWDTRAPVGTYVTSARASNVRMIVVESGTARLHTWRRQQRDVAADYRALFGREAPRVGGIAVMVDADDTAGEAEALVGGLTFAPTRSENEEMPTSMLR